jgi:SAM-dependent methyltransferase
VPGVRIQQSLLPPPEGNVNGDIIPSRSDLDPALRARLDTLLTEGWEIWDRFDSEVRGSEWHPFVAADYEQVLDALLPLRSPGLRFLEWGSATGIITIMADLLGFEAYGIELDPQLVEVAREMARRYDSGARFVVGSFIPTGYRWRPTSGDGRLGTIGEGRSAYPSLGRPLEDFDLVYGYPWTGEEPMMVDLMKCYGGRNARLLIRSEQRDLRVYSGGRLIG